MIITVVTLSVQEKKKQKNSAPGQIAFSQLVWITVVLSYANILVEFFRKTRDLPPGLSPTWWTSTDATQNTQAAYSTQPFVRVRVKVASLAA